jgi:hypothetical protein
VASASRKTKSSARKTFEPKTSGPSASFGLAPVVSIAVGVLAVFGALNSFQVSQDYSAQYPDAYGGARAEIRFAPLAARTPSGAQLGYITDLDPSQPAYAAAFLAAQYALAPRLLVTLTPTAGDRPEWAAGNFTRPQDYAAAGAPLGYEAAADLGQGVVLFHRK